MRVCVCVSVCMRVHVQHWAMSELTCFFKAEVGDTIQMLGTGFVQLSNDAIQILTVAVCLQRLALPTPHIPVVHPRPQDALQPPLARAPRLRPKHAGSHASHESHRSRSPLCPPSSPTSFTTETCDNNENKVPDTHTDKRADNEIDWDKRIRHVEAMLTMTLLYAHRSFSNTPHPQEIADPASMGLDVHFPNVRKLVNAMYGTATCVGFRCVWSVCVLPCVCVLPVPWQSLNTPPPPLAGT